MGIRFFSETVSSGIFGRRERSGRSGDRLLAELSLSGSSFRPRRLPVRGAASRDGFRNCGVRLLDRVRSPVVRATEDSSIGRRADRTGAESEKRRTGDVGSGHAPVVGGRLVRIGARSFRRRRTTNAARFRNETGSETETERNRTRSQRNRNGRAKAKSVNETMESATHGFAGEAHQMVAGAEGDGCRQVVRGNGKADRAGCGDGMSASADGEEE